MLIFLLTDGSARAVRESQESKPELGLLQKLSSRDNGQVIGEL